MPSKELGGWLLLAARPARPGPGPDPCECVDAEPPTGMPSKETMECSPLAWLLSAGVEPARQRDESTEPAAVCPRMGAWPLEPLPPLPPLPPDEEAPLRAEAPPVVLPPCSLLPRLRPGRPSRACRSWLLLPWWWWCADAAAPAGPASEAAAARRSFSACEDVGHARKGPGVSWPCSTALRGAGRSVPRERRMRASMACSPSAHVSAGLRPKATAQGTQKGVPDWQQGHQPAAPRPACPATVGRRLRRRELPGLPGPVSCPSPQHGGGLTVRRRIMSSMAGRRAGSTSRHSRMRSATAWGAS